MPNIPEGPEVKRIADCLAKLLIGKTLVDLRYDQNSRYVKKGIVNHAALLAKLPLKITGVRTKGKKIILCLENDVYLLSFLGLEGRWMLEPADHSNLWMTLAEEIQIEAPAEIPAAAEPKATKTVYYDDSRHFGLIEIVLSTADLNTRLKTIGPDLLSDNVTNEIWMDVIRKFITKVRSGRMKDRQICDFMLNQRFVSGIGNYIRAEALYRAKIRPDAYLSELSDEEHERVRTASIDVIKESYAAQGCTLRTYWDVEGKAGTFKVVVYSHDKDPLDNPVVTSTFNDERTMHWVPAVQIYPICLQGVPPRVKIVDPEKTKKQATPRKTPPTALFFDLEKVKRSTGRGGDQYTLIELKELARQKNQKVTGTKADLVSRLLAAN